MPPLQSHCLHRKSDVVFIVPNKISFSTLHDIITSAAQLNDYITISIICPHSLNNFITDSLLHSKIAGSALARLSFVDLNNLSDQFKWQSRIHKLLVLLMTPRSYSQHYAYLSNNLNSSKSPIKTIIRKWLSGRLSFNGSSNVNKFIDSLCSVYTRNVFESSIVITTSPGHPRHLLVDRCSFRIIIQESWDHCAKLPLGFFPDVVYCWNQDLARDWKYYQGAHVIKSLFPFKLRWAIDSEYSWTKPGSNTIMYVSSFSGQAYVDSMFALELKLIHWILSVFSQGLPHLRLYIKPKPNGRMGDFDQIAQEFDNVVIGEYSSATSSTDYILDSEYNSSRMNELLKVDAVICLATTFALDAALHGVPVVMIDPRQCIELGDLANFCDNFHLRQYLYSLPSAYSLSKTLDESTISFVQRFECPYSSASDFSSSVQDWLAPSMSYENAVHQITSKISDIIANSSVNLSQP